LTLYYTRKGIVATHIAWAANSISYNTGFLRTFDLEMWHTVPRFFCVIVLLELEGEEKTINMSENGIFGRAFKREVGKNTGKVVSNFLFRDSWSTPHKIVSEKAKIKTEREQQRKDNEQLYAVDAAVLENIDKVATFRLSNDKENLLEQLSELTVQLSANKYHDLDDDDEAKIRNKFNDALMEKYKQALIRLKAIDPNEPLLEYYKKAYKKAKRSKRWRKHMKLYILLFLMAGIVLAGMIASAFE